MWCSLYPAVHAPVLHLQSYWFTAELLGAMEVKDDLSPEPSMYSGVYLSIYASTQVWTRAGCALGLGANHCATDWCCAWWWNFRVHIFVVVVCRCIGLWCVAVTGKTTKSWRRWALHYTQGRHSVVKFSCYTVGKILSVQNSVLLNLAVTL